MEAGRGASGPPLGDTLGLWVTFPEVECHLATPRPAARTSEWGLTWKQGHVTS